MKANHMARLGVIIDSIRCELLGMSVTLRQSEDGSYAYVQVNGYTPDARSQSVSIRWSGRKWLLSIHMTETEVVNTCLLAFQQAIMHELHEAITYQDKPVFDPHCAVWERLGNASAMRDVRPTSIDGAA